jgi:hypothetical protein
MKTALNKVLDFMTEDSPRFLVAFASVILAELLILIKFFPPQI